MSKFSWSSGVSQHFSACQSFSRPAILCQTSAVLSAGNFTSLFMNCEKTRQKTKKRQKIRFHDVACCTVKCTVLYSQQTSSVHRRPALSPCRRRNPLSLYRFQFSLAVVTVDEGESEREAPRKRLRRTGRPRAACQAEKNMNTRETQTNTHRQAGRETKHTFSHSKYPKPDCIPLVFIHTLVRSMT